MTKIKMSKKEIVIRAFMFIFAYVFLMLSMFLMFFINNGNQVFALFQERVNNVITVTVSSAILTLVVYFYFFIENKNVLARPSKIIEMFLLMYIAFIICGTIAKYIAPTARPLLFYSLMTAMILRRREAIFVNSVFALILFIFNRLLNSADIVSGEIQLIESFSSLLTVFAGGVVAIFMLKNIKTRLACVLIGVVLFIPTVLINVVMQLTIISGDVGFEVIEVFLYSAFDCMFSVLLFMAILPIVEAVFGEFTPFRLRELTSDGAKLISKMKQNALGTYNHCIVVAQLAEACASAIGEDSELARAAAYYHDVGKLKNPEMFTENQSEFDLHKELTPELSVDIIRSHTREGAKLIKKNRLPEFFADIAVEHHGTMPIKYFYAKALKMSDGELNVANYSYPGPTPTTKIAAIIMIADASEAACRSLRDRSPENVAALVGNIVEERMNMEQFSNCEITMRELTLITRTVINQLAGVYHSRVKYPKLQLSRK